MPKNEQLEIVLNAGSESRGREFKQSIDHHLEETKQHVANLDAGMSRASVLVAFSESPENQVSLMGQMVNGIVLDS